MVEKSLDVVNSSDLKDKVSDVVIVGNPDTFQLLCKASSKEQGWMKSCKAMDVKHGCVVQVTTQQGSNVAEALVFVPGVMIEDDVNGGRKLVPADPYEGYDEDCWECCDDEDCCSKEDGSTEEGCCGKEECCEK